MKNNLSFDNFLKYCDKDGLDWWTGDGIPVKISKYTNIGVYNCFLDRKLMGMFHDTRTGWIIVGFQEIFNTPELAFQRIYKTLIAA